MRKIFFPTALIIAMLGLVSPSYGQFISTIAGGGSGGLGDGGPADSAELYYPKGVAVDAAGNIYIADSYHHRIRLVTAATGIITTIVGTGTSGFSGDSGLAVNAKINTPSAVALDDSGNLYIADYGNQRIRRVDAITGIITTIAGDSAAAGYNGDNIPAVHAYLNNPNGIVADSAGDIYIGDSGNGRVRRVDAISGIITTVAGGGPANPGEDSLATRAELFEPQGLAIGPGGILYLSDGFSSRVRQVDPVTHILTTIAGYGVSGYNQDGVPAVTAELNAPYGLLLQDTTLYIADANNERIRAVGLPSDYISTITGDGSATYGGDGAYAYNGEVNNPTALAQDPAGNIYIADMANDRIRIITPFSLGIAGVAASDNISVYPNPSSGKFTIQVQGNANNNSVQVYDVVGEKVYQSALSGPQSIIDLSGQPAGMYFISVRSVGSVQTTKVLIAK